MTDYTFSAGRMERAEARAAEARLRHAGFDAHASTRYSGWTIRVSSEREDVVETVARLEPKLRFESSR
ncbi:hypothetical protein GCM10009616_18250 [Microlunatus lacustris]